MVWKVLCGSVRQELAAAADPIERQELFDRLVAAAYQHGKALRSATTFELDDVIDPAETRAWLPDCRADDAVAQTIRDRSRSPRPANNPSHPARRRAGVLASGAATDTGRQPWPPGRRRAAILAAGAAVAVGIAASAARVVLEDDLSRRRPVIDGPAANVSAEANGAAAIAAATAPATTSGFMRFNFANIPVAYPYAGVRNIARRIGGQRWLRRH